MSTIVYRTLRDEIETILPYPPGCMTSRKIAEILGLDFLKAGKSIAGSCMVLEKHGLVGCKWVVTERGGCGKAWWRIP